MTQVTDAMIEKALDAWFDGDTWRQDNDESVDRQVTGMRAALEAALAVAPKSRGHFEIDPSDTSAFAQDVRAAGLTKP